MTRQRHKTRHPGIYYREDGQGLRRYIVWYKDALGTGRTKTLPPGHTLSDAKAMQFVLASSKPVPTRITMGQLLDQWLDTRRPGLKPGTLTIYTWGVNRAKKDVGHIRVQDFTADSIVALRRKWVLEGYKKHTISKIEGPLRMALKSAARDELIRANPFDKLLVHERVAVDQRQMRCLEPDEIAKLLDHAEEWYPLFATLLFTGLRISEARALRWEDVDLDEGLLYVKIGKTEAAHRSIMVIDALQSILRAWKLKQEAGAELVFPYPYRTIHGALRRTEDAAGLPHFTLHELRHTFASILISSGEQPMLVAKQMGHKTPDITLKVYAHFYDAQNQIDRARERLQASYGQVLGKSSAVGLKLA